MFGRVRSVHKAGLALQWSAIVTQANSRLESLWDPNTVKTLGWVLKTNTRVAKALGPGFMVQLSRIFLEMLHVYKLYSGFAVTEVKQKVARVDGRGLL